MTLLNGAVERRPENTIGRSSMFIFKCIECGEGSLTFRNLAKKGEYRLCGRCRCHFHPSSGIRGRCRVCAKRHVRTEMKDDVCEACQKKFEPALTIWYDLKVGAYRVDIDQERVLRIATTPVPPHKDPRAFTESLQYRHQGEMNLPTTPRRVCRIKKEN